MEHSRKWTRKRECRGWWKAAAAKMTNYSKEARPGQHSVQNKAGRADSSCLRLSKSKTWVIKETGLKNRWEMNTYLPAFRGRERMRENGRGNNLKPRLNVLKWMKWHVFADFWKNPAC